MINKDALAAASIAQIFGSELLKIQESARTDSGTQPKILQLDPKEILLRGQQNQQQPRNKIEEMKLFQTLQREAEAQCPLPPSVSSPSPQPTQPAPVSMQAPIPQPAVQAPLTLSDNSEMMALLEKMNTNFETIAKALTKIASLGS